MVLDPEGERRARQQTRHQATHCASCESCWPVFLLLHRFSSHTPFLFIYLPSPHLYLLEFCLLKEQSGCSSAAWLSETIFNILHLVSNSAPRFILSTKLPPTPHPHLYFEVPQSHYIYYILFPKTLIYPAASYLQLHFLYCALVTRILQPTRYILVLGSDKFREFLLSFDII